MQLVKRIIKYIFFSVSFFPAINLSAQVNSPFSRYGIGDLYAQNNIATAGMGGISAAYTSDQSLNSVNPATYTALRYVKLFGGSNGGLITYDIGVNIMAASLRSANPVASYKSNYFIPSYILMGMPLSSKAQAKGRNAAMIFGFRPASKVNYNISSATRNSIDSLQSLYQGDGGLYQVFVGLAKRYGNFSVGVNAGYQFGRKEIDTRVIFLNDTVVYKSSLTSGTTDFWGFFVQPGFTYNIKLSESQNKFNRGYKDGYFLRIGASGTLEQKLKANSNVLEETFTYDQNGTTVPVDTVSFVNQITGNITVPVTYTAGFLLSKKVILGKDITATKWSAGVDYSAGQWTNYRYFNHPEPQLVNSSTIKFGGEFVPNLFSENLFSRATYRLGFYTGKDYINADGNGYKTKAVTLGFGFSLKKWRSYDNQTTLINTAFEFGKRGTNVNNITQNFFKLSVGLSLGDLWFAKRRYD